MRQTEKLSVGGPAASLRGSQTEAQFWAVIFPEESSVSGDEKEWGVPPTSFSSFTAIWSFHGLACPHL